jgi:hypothetical protein
VNSGLLFVAALAEHSVSLLLGAGTLEFISADTAATIIVPRRGEVNSGCAIRPPNGRIVLLENLFYRPVRFSHFSR